ncbi:MAG: 50S ribosomal protein L6 [Clostridiales bacterium]|nr:50S ribosomal protein L6 [Clostridiales bacterium]
MSRIGRTPIAVPAGVTVKVGDGNVISVKGPKGELTREIRPEISVDVAGETITLTRPSDDPGHRELHGLSRTLIANMIIGVTDGYSKELQINGVGYRASKEGKKLIMLLGYSHQIIVEERDGLTIDVPAQNRIIVSGIDKQALGQFAADIRKQRPPESYHGKGNKNADEVNRRKVGKTGVK